MSKVSVAAELARYGPQARGTRTIAPSEAVAYCRDLARSHYENFSVASWLLPKRLLPHFYAIYAYCRWADDLADEVSDAHESLSLLDWWEQELDACYAGVPRHPVFVALRATIEEFSIPREPFMRLLTAFRQDQHVRRYETPEAVLAYCDNSANPVGRLVLYLGRCHDDERGRLADSICTGLQLANFCQDVRRDYALGRIYLPHTTLAEAGYSEAMFAVGEYNDAFRRAMTVEVDRAEGYRRSGAPLVGLMPQELRLQVALFIDGGLSILRAIRDLDYNVWRKRPTVSRLRQCNLLARLVAHAWHGQERSLPMSPEVEASFAHCRRIARRSGSSFYYSFLLLPKPQRLAMCALYAFLRHTDDLSDSAQQVEDRRRALLDWRRATLAAIAGHAHSDPLLPALADTMTRYQIPVEHLTAAIDGVEMDLDVRRYETFTELEGYCQRVASAVGLACLRIWGCEVPEAIEPARRCGVAFQMTNILRDVKEDAARDRIYLPQEDLRRFGYTSDDLLAGVCDERFRNLMHFEIDRTERLFAEGQQLERWLPPARRRVFGSMLAMYRTLLAEIKRLDGDVLNHRARLGGWQKVRIAARWLLRPPPRAVAEVIHS